MEILRTGAIRTVIGAHVPWSELPAQLERMAARQTPGRLVVTTGARLSPTGHR